MSANVSAKEQADTLSHPDDELLSVREVCAKVSLGKTKLYGLIKDGAFPAGKQISPGAVRWSRNTVNGWIAQRFSEAG